MEWKPTIPPDGNGYVTADKSAALRDACERLNVVATAPPILGHTHKSIGAPVVSPDGARSWIKVSGRRDQLADALRDREIEARALTGVPKPRVITHIDWQSADIHWRALQMTLAPSPVVQATPWSGPRASAVTNGWISQLRGALGALSRVRCDRYYLTPDPVATLIRSRFGDNAPVVADEWDVAFCETHWANLTAPHLTMLDWELWGRAPRGYDAALIIAFSAADSSLVQRLRAAFADDLQTPSGRVSQLATCAQLLTWIDMELVHPGLREPVLELAHSVLHDAEAARVRPRPLAGRAAALSQIQVAWKTTR